MAKLYKVDNKKIEAKVNEKNNKTFYKLLICIIIVSVFSIIFFIPSNFNIPIGILLFGIFFIEIPALLFGCKYFWEYISYIGWSKYQNAYNYLVDDQENVYKITYKMDWNHYNNMASLTDSTILKALSLMSDINSLQLTDEYTLEQIVNVYSIKENDGLFEVTCDMYNKKLNTWKQKCIQDISDNIEDYQELITYIQKKINNEKVKIVLPKSNNKFINFCLNNVSLKWQKVIMISCYCIHYFINLIAFYYASLNNMMSIIYLIVSVLLLLFARIYAKNFTKLSQNLKYTRYNISDLIVTLIIYFVIILS